MIPTKGIFSLATFIILTLLISGCSTRGMHDQYFGATEQRLLTRSIDELMKKLPDEDFQALCGKKVHLICHFVNPNATLRYAKSRLEIELQERFLIHLVPETDNADTVLEVFFDALGTDNDSFGFKTPSFIVPGFDGTVSIDIISLDMYHGISELYYYTVDQQTGGISRGDRLKAVSRADKLALPIISIPISSLDW